MAGVSRSGSRPTWPATHNISGAQLAVFTYFNHGAQPEGSHDTADRHGREIVPRLLQPASHGGVEGNPVDAHEDLARPGFEVERHDLFAERGRGDVRLGAFGKYDPRVVRWGHCSGYDVCAGVWVRR